MNKKGPEKEQLEDDSGEISCGPQIQVPMSLCPPLGQRNSQCVREEGRADVCRILAVSILIVKMSDGSAKWGEGNIGWACHSPLASF